MKIHHVLSLIALLGAMNAPAGTFVLVDRDGQRTFGPFEYADGQELDVDGRTFVLSLQAEARSIAEQRAREILLPAIEMRQASVSDAVDYFREAALAAAGPNQMPNIIVEVASPTPITLNLQRASLYDALRYSSEVAGCQLRWEGNNVVFTDKKFR